MSDKQLKEKAVKISGKDYVLVSDRVIYFNEKYPNGSISTSLVSNIDGEIVVKAVVCPDIENLNRIFTGYAQEKVGAGFINKTSALENAETSAVGRALAMMGIGVIDSIASIDEIHKANNRQEESRKPVTSEAQTGDTASEHFCSECHSSMIHKTGEVKTGKNKGRVYQGWFCSTPNNQHKPLEFEWLD